MLTIVDATSNECQEDVVEVNSTEDLRSTRNAESDISIKVRYPKRKTAFDAKTQILETVSTLLPACENTKNDTNRSAEMESKFLVTQKPKKTRNNIDGTCIQASTLNVEGNGKREGKLKLHSMVNLDLKFQQVEKLKRKKFQKKGSESESVHLTELQIANSNENVAKKTGRSKLGELKAVNEYDSSKTPLIDVVPKLELNDKSKRQTRKSVRIIRQRINGETTTSEFGKKPIGVIDTVVRASPKRGKKVARIEKMYEMLEVGTTPHAIARLEKSSSISVKKAKIEPKPKSSRRMQKNEEIQNCNLVLSLDEPKILTRNTRSQKKFDDEPEVIVPKHNKRNTKSAAFITSPVSTRTRQRHNTAK